MVAKQWLGHLVMAPKSVTFRRHDHLVSVLFWRFATSHSYNITFSMFLYLVLLGCAMYIDVLKAPSLLSLTLQNEFVDIVQGIKNNLQANENES